MIKKLKEVQKRQIIERYLNQESLIELAKEYNVSYITLNRIIKKAGVFKHSLSKMYSKELEKEVISLYGKVLNLEICSKLGINNNAVCTIIKRNNLNLKGTGNKIVETEALFDLDSDEVQYWLGYIAGDGNLNQSNRNKTISISTKDIEITEKFKNWYKGLNGVKVYNRKYNTNLGEQTIYNIHIHNILAYNYLVNIGITPNKSKTLNIKVPLTWSFIRGLFDSDGSIRSNRFEFKITTGSPFLRDQLIDFFNLNGIKSRVNIKGNSLFPCFDVNISNMENIQKLYNFMYINSTVYLQRKFDRFKKLINRIDKGYWENKI